VVTRLSDSNSAAKCISGSDRLSPCGCHNCPSRHLRKTQRSVPPDAGTGVNHGKPTFSVVNYDLSGEKFGGTWVSSSTNKRPSILKGPVFSCAVARGRRIHAFPQCACRAGLLGEALCAVLRPTQSVPFFRQISMSAFLRLRWWTCTVPAPVRVGQRKN
jgi:hypothetical protein